MADTRLQVQAGTFYLAGSGAIATATTITLSSFKQIDGTTNLTMAMFGTVGYATLEPNGGTQEESISFTGATQNASGTCTLTGVSTVLFISPYTATSGLAKAHPGGSKLIITNTSKFYSDFVNAGNDEAITGEWTFPTPLANMNPATKLYVDSLVSGGAVTNVANVVSATAGETVASGNLVYFDETQNEWMKCDADTATTVQSVMLGIAQGSGSNGNPITGGVLIFGTDGTQTGMTQGDLLYASNTAGGISATVGTTPRVIGVATSATSLYFNPFFESELARYAIDSVGTDAYAITLPGAFSGYYPGMVINFKAGTANTGGATLAVNGGAAKAILKDTTSALNTGDIGLNQVVMVIYDGTNFQLISRAKNSGPYLKRYVFADSPATWTKPSGLTSVIVEVVGGGGGGGGSTTVNESGGGGGGGGYSRKIVSAFAAGVTETVTIGNGGTAGAATGGTGGTGGTSSFGTQLQATGGVGGSTGVNAAGGAGGIGSLGIVNAEGGDGGAGIILAASNLRIGGYGGSSYFGAGGSALGGVLESAGIGGNLFGGGGSGAVSGGGDAAGGAGGAGLVIVTEFFS